MIPTILPITDVLAVKLPELLFADLSITHYVLVSTLSTYSCSDSLMNVATYCDFLVECRSSSALVPL
ncbi:hypothetical protein M8C21_006481, partial [Ambrosia artemisiifolia]